MFCCRRPGTDDTIDASCARETPVCNDVTKLTTTQTARHGISGRAAAELLERIRHASPSTSAPTCKDAVVNVIKPLTRNASYVDYIIATDKAKHRELVGTATIFVSHAWSACVVGLLEAIVAQSNSMAPSIPFFWLDICSNNQHVIDQASGNSDMGWEWWTTAFKRTIEEAGRMLVVLAPYDDPIVCKRAWCLFEAVVAHRAGIPIDIAVPPSESKSLAESIRTSFDVVNRVMLNIDSSNAGATVEADLQNIRRLITETVEGGYATVDDIYKVVLRDWLIDTACTLVEHDDNPGTEAAADLMCNVAGMLYFAGQFDRALEYHQKTLLIYNSIFGTDANLSIASTYNDIGLVHYSKGTDADIALAIDYFSKAITIKEEFLDQGSFPKQSLAKSYNNLGLCHHMQENFVLALENFQKDVDISQEIFGQDSLDVAMTLNNMGATYAQIEDYDKALECSNKALAAKIRHLGEKHPDTVTSYNNLGGLLCMQDKYEEAIKMHSKALAARRAVLGDNHHLIAEVYCGLGNAYTSKGDLVTGKQYYEDAVGICHTNDLDETHPIHALALRALAQRFS
eukprot:m.736705 g.736705  ORF g.736705 m.736705 type:complete len:570 (+) comp23096_c0_seq1:193-1902(+)